MKQGSATESRSGSTKSEPKATGVNPEHVADMGSHKVYLKNIPMYEGRGLEAPMAGSECHPCGSQGKHK